MSSGVLEVLPTGLPQPNLHWRALTHHPDWGCSAPTRVLFPLILLTPDVRLANWASAVAYLKWVWDSVDVRL